MLKKQVFIQLEAEGRELGRKNGQKGIARIMRGREIGGANSCDLSVCWKAISSQVSGPINEIFSGDVGDHYGSAYFKYEHDLLSLKFFDFCWLFGFFLLLD